MATYVSLIDWTQRGVEKFQVSVDRYEAARSEFESMGVRSRDIYWTLGSHSASSTLPTARR